MEWVSAALQDITDKERCKIKVIMKSAHKAKT